MRCGKTPLPVFGALSSSRPPRRARLGEVPNRTQPGGDILDQRVVIEVARRGHDHAAGAIARFKKAEQVFPPEARHGFFPAADGPADRVVGEKVQPEQIVHVIVGRIFRLRNLLQDHRSLALDLVRVEGRMKKNVGQKIDRKRQVFVQNLGVIAGVLLGGECVDDAAHGVHFFGDLRRAAPFRAFE